MDGRVRSAGKGLGMPYIARLAGYMPLCMMRGGSARGVTPFHRLSNALFGSPNWRRGNGIISTRFEIAVIVRKLVDGARRRLGLDPSARPMRTAPIHALDRTGTFFDEGLPRIWLSETVSNTDKDDGRRVFVECYPNGPDEGGICALELACRYLGEGAHGVPGSDEESIECFKAAEILLLHAVRRGNREAVRLLHELYRDHLGAEARWRPLIEERAQHSRPSSLRDRIIYALLRRRHQGLPAVGPSAPHGVFVRFP